MTVALLRHRIGEWGLRDYGFEQIFGGDPGCEHKWSFSKIEHDALRYRGHNANVGSNKNPEIHPGKEGSGGNFCSCGAWKGQLGLEPTPELYIEHLTKIFNEVKRVLKKEGTLWLNIGDTYNSQPSGTLSGAFANRPSKQACFEERKRRKENPLNYGNVQIKSLCMIPERLAWSLIQNGWILRNKIIWYKPNAMPSSVTDRFSNTHEFLYMFSRSQRYYFDLDAVREAYTRSTHERMKYTINKIPRAWANEEAIPMSGGKTPNFNISDIGKNPGDVFEINTQQFPDTHFAVFPEKLCEKPIKAGCPEGGIVLDPFAGAGTALYVAKELKRRYIGIDIKQEYCDMCEKRLAQGVL